MHLYRSFDSKNAGVFDKPVNISSLALKILADSFIDNVLAKDTSIANGIANCLFTIVHPDVMTLDPFIYDTEIVSRLAE